MRWRKPRHAVRIDVRGIRQRGDIWVKESHGEVSVRRETVDPSFNRLAQGVLALAGRDLTVALPYLHLGEADAHRT